MYVYIIFFVLLKWGVVKYRNVKSVKGNVIYNRYGFVFFYFVFVLFKINFMIGLKIVFSICIIRNKVVIIVGWMLLMFV